MVLIFAVHQHMALPILLDYLGGFPYLSAHSRGVVVSHLEAEQFQSFSLGEILVEVYCMLQHEDVQFVLLELRRTYIWYCFYNFYPINVFFCVQNNDIFQAFMVFFVNPNNIPFSVISSTMQGVL